MRRFFFIDGALHKNENYDRDMRFHQGWLGLTLSCTDGAIVIDGIADGSPSQKCGELSVGDKILALTDTDNERIPINTMPVEKATQFLRGIVGQPVRIEFQGINSDKSKIVELTRGQYIPQSNTLKTVK
jgi:C-terminal processing protease CtpA/Prc